MPLNERMDYAALRKKEMNCCQAVLVAFADQLGRSEDELLRLGSGFGSGMGTMEGTCGALVGAIMVSSLLSEKGAAMAASRAIMPRFRELCGGATICRDLKGIDTGKVLCSCENCVRNAVQAAAERNFQDVLNQKDKNAVGTRGILRGIGASK
ncbi:MAG: C_GCAxxG_C_C family protein [Kiritimatiellae bacterium]|nr:C_GCAxxG_C_C family protein [Kiritimatiellia bacterium]